MNTTPLIMAFSLGSLVVALGCVSDPEDPGPDMTATDAAMADMNADGPGGCEGAGPPINPETLGNGVVGVAYEQALEVFGGNPEGVTWSIAEGALPTGLALDAMTGVISGTPTMAGDFDFAVNADIPPSGGCVIQPAFREFTMTVTERDTAGDWSCVQRNPEDFVFACSDYPGADEAAASAHCDTMMGSGELITATFTEGPCPVEDRFGRCRYEYMGTTVFWIFYGNGDHIRQASSCHGRNGVYERL